MSIAQPNCLRQPPPLQKLVTPRPLTSGGAFFLLLKKLVFNFVMDAAQPFFRARRTITEMCGLDLKLSRSFFRRAKLRRKLMREFHGPGAVIIRHLGCLLQQGNDSKLARRLRETRSGRQRSLREISRELAERGFVAARTGRPFEAAQVARMLAEEVP
jgi:hypothetical protein